MSILNELLEIYPELENGDAFLKKEIVLQDDLDGEGIYISEWNYNKPLPDGFKLGK